MEHECCKYILSCLVHKESKDISTKPTKQGPGRLQEAVREERNRDIAEERAVIQAAEWLGGSAVENNFDLDHQMKKMRVEGMQSQMEKNKVDCIMTQIDLMERMRDVYVRNMGREKYEARIVCLMNTMPGIEQDLPSNLVGTSIAAP